MFSEKNVAPISLKQLDTIIGDLKQNKLYLSKSYKVKVIQSIIDNFENMNELLDIDSWFDDDA